MNADIISITLRDVQVLYKQPFTYSVLVDSLINRKYHIQAPWIEALQLEMHLQYRGSVMIWWLIKYCWLSKYLDSFSP